MKLLILRPEPGAGMTAARARALGLDPVVAPLFTVSPLPWSAPDPAGFDGVMMTSANAARHAGPALAAFRHLPLYAVGRATADAAAEAGFAEVRTGDGDVATLAALAAGHGVRTLLHLAGRDHKPFAQGLLHVERRIVYASDAVDELPATALVALRAGAVVVLHSARAAACFRTLLGVAGVERGTVAIAAISAAALAEAGAGWRAAIASAEPGDEALLAAAARLCD